MKAIRYHVPDAGTYSDETNSDWCSRCQRRIGSELWEQTCPGRPGGVEFDHIFKPGEPVECAGSSAIPATERSTGTPSHTEDT
jgi:hypothetical protein